MYTSCILTFSLPTTTINYSRPSRVSLVYSYVRTLCMISLHISPRSSLPQSFTSLYRLFLRATSASVLHQSRSTRSLRRLWRPTFKYAGNVIHRLQSETLGTPERARMESWLKVWDTRSTFYSTIHAQPSLKVSSGFHAESVILFDPIP